MKLRAAAETVERRIKRQNTSRRMSSTSTSGRIVKKIVDSMELLWDMEITTSTKNPKGIAEGKCPIFTFNHIAHSPMGLGLMYFVPHRCFPILELVEVVKGAYDPATRVARDLQGNAILSLDPMSIATAFCPPPPMYTPLLVNWDMKPSSNMRPKILEWLNKNTRGTANFRELPSAEVPLSNFSAHLQLLLSMLSIMVGERTDRYVSP